MGKNSEEKRNEVPGRYATACREGRGKAGRRRRGKREKRGRRKLPFTGLDPFSSPTRSRGAPKLQRGDQCVARGVWQYLFYVIYSPPLLSSFSPLLSPPLLVMCLRRETKDTLISSRTFFFGFAVVDVRTRSFWVPSNYCKII